MIVPFSIPLVIGLLAQATAPVAEKTAERAARLEIMKASLSNYDLHANDDPKATFRMQSEPVIRFDNPISGSKDGAIFLWLGSDDRPAAAVQVYLNRTDTWLQEFSSLSTGVLSAQAVGGRVRPVAWRRRAQALARCAKARGDPRATASSDAHDRRRVQPGRRVSERDLAEAPRAAQAVRSLRQARGRHDRWRFVFDYVTSRLIPKPCADTQCDAAADRDSGNTRSHQ